MFAATRCALSPNRALRFSIIRSMKRHKAFYDSEFRPMLQSMPRAAFDACHIVKSPVLRNVMYDAESGRVATMDDIIAFTDANEKLAIEGLRAIAHVKQRLDNTNHKSLIDVPYALNVGDTVLHSTFKHEGVVAARLPICFESDTWIMNNLGSLDDDRLKHPWYIVLVGPQMGLPRDFVRYGSQLTHTRMPEGKPIGAHRMLPIFFRDYDPVEQRYVPRFNATGDMAETELAGCRTPRVDDAVEDVEETSVAAPVSASASR